MSTSSVRSDTVSNTPVTTTSHLSATADLGSKGSKDSGNDLTPLANRVNMLATGLESAKKKNEDLSKSNEKLEKENEALKKSVTRLTGTVGEKSKELEAMAKTTGDNKALLKNLRGSVHNTERVITSIEAGVGGGLAIAAFTYWLTGRTTTT